MSQEDALVPAAANQNSAQEEVSLLAAIGSTIQESTKYESQVLSEATQSSAPKLSGVGFPDLSQLAPSYTKLVTNDESKASNKRRKVNNSQKQSAPPGDIPHILKVLSDVTAALDGTSTTSENRQTQILRMKRQILLTYLATNTNLSRNDVGIDIAKEAREEERRRENLIRQGNQESRKGRKKSTIATTFNHEAKVDDDGDARTPSSASSSRSSKHSRRVAQRLENIKRGEIEEDEEPIIEVLSKSSTASFGKQALMARNASIENAKRKGTAKKMSMMSMKRKLVEDGGEVWVDPEELWKKRMARLERRRQRRGLSGKERGAKSASQASEEVIEEEDSTIALLDSDAVTNSNYFSETKRVVRRSSASLAAAAVAVKQETHAVENVPSSDISSINVQCSICGENLDVPNDWNDGPDAFLSHHMNQCQLISKVRSRSTRRSRRTTLKPISYKDDDDDGDHDDDNFDSVETSTSEQGQSDQGVSKDDFVGDAESSEDEMVKEKVSKEEILELSDKSGYHDYKFELKKTVDDFNVDDYEDRIDDWIECGIQSMNDMDEKHEDDEKPGAVTFAGGLEIPAWVNDRLFGYQRTALRWLWELHNQEAGGIVGDEMGLGKTVQVCSFLGAMAASRKLRSILIVAPATILMHWLSELSKWAPGLRRILLHQSAERKGESNRAVSRRLLLNLEKWLALARADRINEPIDEKDLLENGADSFCGTGYVVLTTFENIRRSSDVWQQHKWTYVVIDEGQKIRNPDADVTIACKRLRTPHRLLLSGTPIQNDLKELWSLFDFVFPGRLGVLPVFLSEFADPIRRGGYSNASPMQVQLAYRCALVLRDLINPFLLRRQKKDMKEVSRMPSKTEQVLFCKLSRRQRSMYEAYLRSDEVVNIIRGSAQCFKPIIMLRKICNHPDLICRPDEEYESFLKNGFVNEKDLDNESSSDEAEFDAIDSEESTLVDRAGKLEVLAKILPLWKKQGHRVLIFSQWKKMLDIIQHFMNINGYKFGRLDGNTNIASRQRLVDTFNNDSSYFAMLLTTKTGGVGLNLTGANRIILYDPDWNPQSDAQARERAWRFGQKNAVTVYRLITAGTIEEKIYQRQIFKTALTNQVLQDPRQRRMFSQKDLRDLFTLKADVHSVSKGGEGVTETGELTKGRGVIDVEEGPEESQGSDDKETMVEVLKSKGLAGVFDHDIVDKPYAKKSSTLREMERDASKVAARAARSLVESTTGTEDTFTPTWTGSNTTEPRRFGGVSKIQNSGEMNNPRSFDSDFGGARSAGLGAGGGAISSAALLSRIQQRRKEIQSGGATAKKVDKSEESFAVNLITRIRSYIKRYSQKTDLGPSTAEILSEFNDVKDTDAVLFKSILKQVAVVCGGRWELR